MPSTTRHDLHSVAARDCVDYSVSLTKGRNQQPLVRKLAACEYTDQDRTALDAEGEEEALLLYYDAEGWLAGVGVALLGTARLSAVGDSEAAGGGQLASSFGARGWVARAGGPPGR